MQYVLELADAAKANCIYPAVSLGILDDIANDSAVEISIPATVLVVAVR